MVDNFCSKNEIKTKQKREKNEKKLWLKKNVQYNER